MNEIWFSVWTCDKRVVIYFDLFFVWTRLISMRIWCKTKTSYSHPSIKCCCIRVFFFFNKEIEFCWCKILKWTTYKKCHPCELGCEVSPVGILWTETVLMWRSFMGVLKTQRAVCSLHSIFAHVIIVHASKSSRVYCCCELKGEINETHGPSSLS